MPHSQHSLPMIGGGNVDFSVFQKMVVWLEEFMTGAGVLKRGVRTFLVAKVV